MDTRVTARSKFAILLLRRLLVLWAILRLPLLGIGLYLFRQQFLELFERVGGVSILTERAIALISTASERLLMFAICVVVLAPSILLARRARSRLVQLFLPVAISFGLFLVLLTLLSNHPSVLLPLALAGLLAVNTVPDVWLTQFIATKSGRVASNVGFAGAIGVAELLLPKPFLLWLLIQVHGQEVVVSGTRRRVLDLLPVVVVSALLAVFLSTAPLVELGRSLHPDAAVQPFARGDFNMLAFNQEQRVLYANGHGFNALQAYNVDALNQPPRQSQVVTNYAQGFGYSAKEKELYLYPGTSEIQVLDATDLSFKKSIPIPTISLGDSWVVWDRFTDNLIVASEADRLEGTPFVSVNRATGKLTKTLEIGPSYIYISPDKPMLYMNFFRRTADLIQYNTQTNQEVKRVPIDKQVDRMALVTRTNELLVTSPVESSVVRYDADSLARKGDIKTTFGVRTVAVDASRNLLLTGSLATNMLEVIDLKTYKRLAAYRLGPWLREICLDPQSGMAYVSSNGALYRVNYTARL